MTEENAYLFPEYEVGYVKIDESNDEFVKYKSLTQHRIENIRKNIIKTWKSKLAALVLSAVCLFTALEEGDIYGVFTGNQRAEKELELEHYRALTKTVRDYYFLIFSP